MTKHAASGPQIGWRRLVKIGIDRASAVVGLVVVSPLLVTCGVAIRVTMGSPIFFVQERPGLLERRIRLIKFRTMRPETRDGSRALSDAERLTRVGRFLRSTSLDELPQLWNVLRGELSLVGPRPLLVQYLERYSPDQMRRHDVLPGITGWAQVNGRNAISWGDKLALDTWYVDHWSLALDLRILAATAKAVALRRGISQEGHATMPEFMGTAPLDSASTRTAARKGTMQS